MDFSKYTQLFAAYNEQELCILLDNPIRLSDICIHAAEIGDLSSLKYIHEKGFSWCKWVCAIAAEHGHQNIAICHR